MTPSYKSFGVMVKERCLCSDDIDAIKRLSEDQIYTKARVSHDHDLVKGTVSARIRRCRNARITDHSLDHMLLPLFDDYLMKFGLNLDAFTKEESFLETSLVKYRNEDLGFFDWHQDISALGDSLPRTISLSLILNDEYTGGELMFKKSGQTLSTGKLSANTVVMFPASLQHTVTPVTQGHRDVVISWFHCAHEGQISHHLDQARQ